MYTYREHFDEEIAGYELVVRLKADKHVEALLRYLLESGLDLGVQSITGLTSQELEKRSI